MFSFVSNCQAVGIPTGSGGFHRHRPLVVSVGSVVGVQMLTALTVCSAAAVLRISWMMHDWSLIACAHLPSAAALVIYLDRSVAHF